jgi:hypothetical protein
MEKDALIAVVNDANGDLNFLRSVFKKLPEQIASSQYVEGKKLDMIALIGNTPGSQMHPNDLREFNEKAWVPLVNEFKMNNGKFAEEHNISNPAALGNFYAQTDPLHQGAGLFRRHFGIVKDGRIVETGGVTRRLKNFFDNLVLFVKPVTDAGTLVKIMGTNIFQTKALGLESSLDWKIMEIHGTKIASTGFEGITGVSDVSLLAYLTAKNAYEDPVMRESYAGDLKISDIIIAPFLHKSLSPKSPNPRVMSDVPYLIISGLSKPLDENDLIKRKDEYWPIWVRDVQSHRYFKGSPVGVFRFRGSKCDYSYFEWHPEENKFVEGQPMQIHITQAKDSQNTVIIPRKIIPRRLVDTTTDVPPPMPQGQEAKPDAKQADLAAVIKQLESAQEELRTANEQRDGAIRDAQKISEMLAYFVNLVDERIKQGYPELVDALKDKTPIDRVNAYFDKYDKDFRKICDDHALALGEARNLSEQLEKLVQSNADALKAEEEKHKKALDSKQAEIDEAEQYKEEIGKGNAKLEEANVRYSVLLQKAREQYHRAHDEILRLEKRIEEITAGYDSDIVREQDEVTRKDEELRKLKRDVDFYKNSSLELSKLGIEVSQYLMTEFPDGISPGDVKGVFRQFVEKRLYLSESSKVKSLNQQLSEKARQYQELNADYDGLKHSSEEQVHNHDREMQENARDQQAKDSRILELEAKIRNASMAIRKMGCELGEKGNYAAEIAAYTIAISIAKDNDAQLSSLYFNRAIAYESLGNLQCAAEDLEKTLQIDRNDINAQQFLGEVRAKMQGGQR